MQKSKILSKKGRVRESGLVGGRRVSESGLVGGRRVKESGLVSSRKRMLGI